MLILLIRCVKGMSMREPGQIGRAPRIASHHRATLIDTNGREMPGLVTDISKGGFRIKTDEPLMIGECVRVRVDRYGDFAAQIRWSQGLVAGAVFLDPVDLD